MARATWAPIEQEGGRGQSVSPKPERHGGMEQEGAGDVVEGAESTLGTPVLGGRVGAGQAELDAMRSKESPASMVVEFTAMSV